jgi:hypothetical protein
MDEWEDVAYGAPAASSNDGWEDVAFGETIAPETPSLFSDPIGALTSADWWTTRPSGEKISAGQAIAGPALSALDMLTWGQGDEIAAGGNSILDALTGSDSTYSQNLATARGVQNSFHEAAPVASTALEIASSVKNPLLMASKVLQTPGYVAKVLQAGKEGAVAGGLFGFGEGEEGVENRLVNAAKSAGLGALLSGGATGVTQGVSNVLGSYGNRLADASEETLEKGLGLQYGDRSKGLNKVNLFVDDAGEVVPFDQLDDAVGIQAPVQQQIKVLKDSGIFDSAPDDVQALKIHITKEGSKVGKTLPAMVKQADKVIGKENILPAFKTTEKFLEGYRPETRAKLHAEFEGILNDYMTSPGSGLKRLAKFIDQFQNETDFNSTTPREITKLKRAMAFDMRKAAEKEFDAAVPAMAGAYARANEFVAASKSIGKMLNKPMARKSPEFGDFIKGGSLPMTVATGALSAPLGIGPAAMLVGGKLAGNAVKQYAEAAKPISTSKFYNSASGKLLSAAKKKESKGAGKAIVGSLATGQSPEAQPERQSKETSNPKIQPSSLKSGRDYIASKVNLAESKIPPYSERLAPKMNTKAKVERVEAQIDSDPIDSTIYEMESGRNPEARNKESSASGAFQLIKSTARNLGVNNVFDIEENYNGYLKLKEEAKALAKEPEDYYSIHYLGAPTFKKWKAGKSLTPTQEAQVEFLTEKLLPKFKRIYKSKLKTKTGMVEA